MANTPTEFIGDVSDEELDRAIDDQFDDDPPAPTPPTAPEGPADGPAARSDTPDPTADTPPAGDATPEPDDAAQPAPEAASVPPEPVGVPFQFKASGREQTVPYALTLPDGSVVIPKDKQEEFRRELASSRELQANFKQVQRHYTRELQLAKAQRTEKDAEADAITGLLADFFKLQTPEERFAYLSQMEGNFPRLELDLERRKIAEREKLIAEREKGPTLSPEDQQQQFREQVEGEFEVTWQAVEQAEEFKGLTAAQKQAVRQRYQTNPARLVRRATEDDPAHGITKGDHLFDPTDLFDDLRFLAQQTKAVPAKAAERNALVNADQAGKRPVVNAIPPAPKRGTPVGPPRDGDGKFTKFRPGTREYKDYMQSEADEDDAA